MSHVSLAQARSKGERALTGMIIKASNGKMESPSMAAVHLRSSGTAFRVLQSVQLLASFESVKYSAGWRRPGSSKITRLVFSRQQGRCSGVLTEECKTLQQVTDRKVCL